MRFQWPSRQDNVEPGSTPFIYSDRRMTVIVCEDAGGGAGRLGDGVQVPSGFPGAE